MAKLKTLLSRIRLVYRRSSPLLKCVVLVTIVLCTAALLTLRGALMDIQGQTEELRNQAAELEQENSRLEVYIQELGTVEGIRRIANEVLGLVDPNTVFFTPETESNPE